MKILQVNVSGRDEPGITEALTRALAGFDARVLDIGQAKIHSRVVLGLLVSVDPSAPVAEISRAVERVASPYQVSVETSEVAPEDYDRWAGLHEPRTIITVLGRKLEARTVADVCRIIKEHGLNIAQITRLSSREPSTDDGRRACVELSIRGKPDDSRHLRRELLAATGELPVDIAVQTDDMFRRNRRMVAFDMDSTLIQTEVIDELATAAGAGDEVRAITEAAMNGELDFDESLRRRVSTLAGLPETVLEEIAARLPVTEGAERLIGTLRSLGYRTAILSGGFNYFGRHLQQRLGIDVVHANELDIEAGRLTGKVRGAIVNGQRKAELLREIATSEGIDLAQVIAVGDGANDLPMLSVAGLGVAFHAKPKVRESAEQGINTLGLDGILYLLGLRDREIPARPVG